jgi:hypothetical protein
VPRRARNNTRRWAEEVEHKLGRFINLTGNKGRSAVSTCWSVKLLTRSTAVGSRRSSATLSDKGVLSTGVEHRAMLRTTKAAIDFENMMIWSTGECWREFDKKERKRGDEGVRIQCFDLGATAGLYSPRGPCIHAEGSPVTMFVRHPGPTVRDIVWCCAVQIRGRAYRRYASFDAYMKQGPTDVATNVI